ncbi:MAG: flippase-like domain-containing protein [Deltaproteobacteria bacterium]|nr:flippase-like domain-containing protein [Deltaproteobacteria bacterium]
MAAPAPRWARVVNWISLLAGLAGLAWLISHAGVRTLGERLSTIGGWFIAVLAVQLVAHLLDGRIIQLLVRAPDAPMSFLNSLVAQLSGHAINLVTPGGNLGEVTKVTLLYQAGAPRGRAVSGILLFNLAALWVNVLVLVLGIFVIAARVDLPRNLVIAMWIGAGLAATVGLGLALLMGRGALAALARGLGRLGVIGPARAASWQQRLGTIDAQLAEFRGARRGDLVHALALSALSHLASQGEILLVLHALGVPLPLGFALSMMASSLVIRWVSAVVPFGVGVSEGSNYALFDLLGMAPVAGLVLALVQRARQLCFAALGLVLLALAQARGRKRQGGSSV